MRNFLAISKRFEALVQGSCGISSIPICLKAVFLIGLILATNHGVADGFGFLFSIRHYFLALLYLVTWLIALVALLLIALEPTLSVRLLCSLPFVLSALLADIYYALMQLNFNIDSMEALWNMRFWVGDAVGAYWAFMIWPTLRALLFLIVVAIPPVLPRLHFCHVAFLPVIPSLFIAGVVYRTGGYGIPGLPAQFSTLSLAGVFGLYDFSIGEREPVRIQRVAGRALQHIVLIVDESIRGDFIDLAGAGGTTPYLGSIRDLVINFGIASSGNNCSQASNAILRMGANPRTLGMNGDNIMKNPSIWKYAKAAGYETTFLDAQSKNGILINYMNHREKELIDHFIQIDMPFSYQNDH
jgi:hypothetical protein